MLCTYGISLGTGLVFPDPELGALPLVEGGGAKHSPPRHGDTQKHTETHRKTQRHIEHTDMYKKTQRNAQIHTEIHRT